MVLHGACTTQQHGDSIPSTAAPAAAAPGRDTVLSTLGQEQLGKGTVEGYEQHLQAAQQGKGGPGAVPSPAFGQSQAHSSGTIPITVNTWHT